MKQAPAEKKLARLRTLQRGLVRTLRARSTAVKLHLTGVWELNNAAIARRRGDIARYRYDLAFSRRFRILAQQHGKVLP